MSAEFANGITPDLAYHMSTNWGRRQDTVVNIMGLVGPDGGRITNTQDVQDWAKARNYPTSVGNWYGSLDGSKDNTKLANQIIEFIQERYDPRGRLVITGKSRGGMNALQLCRQMAAFCGFFSIRKLRNAIKDDEPKGVFASSAPDSTAFTVKVRIDLVCVIDATYDVGGVDRQQKVPSIVRNARNWYQNREDNGGIHAPLWINDRAQTNLIKDEDCGPRIPWPMWDVHKHLCETLTPPEVKALVEAELKIATPSLAPNRGVQPSKPQTQAHQDPIFEQEFGKNLDAVRTRRSR